MAVLCPRLLFCKVGQIESSVIPASSCSLLEEPDHLLLFYSYSFTKFILTEVSQDCSFKATTLAGADKLTGKVPGGLQPGAKQTLCCGQRWDGIDPGVSSLIVVTGL